MEVTIGDGLSCFKNVKYMLIIVLANQQPSYMQTSKTVYLIYSLYRVLFTSLSVSFLSFACPVSRVRILGPVSHSFRVV